MIYGILVIYVYIVQFVNSPPSVQHSFLARGEGGDIERVYDPQLGKGGCKFDGNLLSQSVERGEVYEITS